MKNTIINILIFILMFNIIMIIFPEGKTQKYCKLNIKIFMFIYIINNIFFNGNLLLGEFMTNIPETNYSYQRELNIKTVDNEFIKSINEKTYKGDDVLKDIKLSFTDELNIKAVITLNRYLNYTEIDNLKEELSDIFNINVENIEVNSFS